MKKIRKTRKLGQLFMDFPSPVESSFTSEKQRQKELEKAWERKAEMLRVFRQEKQRRGYV